jgi:hypothetical protein
VPAQPATSLTLNATFDSGPLAGVLKAATPVAVRQPGK